MYTATFKRYEKKYILNSEQYENIINIFSYNCTPDIYGKSVICSTYYDTYDYRLITTSLKKPVYKEKLRIRTYGIPKTEENVFLELKKKYKGVVYKRRICVKYSDGIAYLADEYDNIPQSQIKNEIDYFKKHYKTLVPSMNIFYNRLAFNDRINPDVRLTIDSDITYRSHDFGLQNGAYGNKILPDGIYLLEIKTPYSLPLWITETLTKLKIYPASFSKYGEAYKNTVLQSSITERGINYVR